MSIKTKETNLNQKLRVLLTCFFAKQNDDLLRIIKEKLA